MVKPAVSEKSPVSGVLKRFSKQQPAAQRPTGFLLLKQAYPSAIEYTGVPAGTRGLAMLVGLLGAPPLMWAASKILVDMVTYDDIELYDIVGIITGISVALVSAYVLGMCIRADLFRPLDEPTIFDRQHRKVYRNYREAYSGWRGMLAKWPCKTAIYDWDNVHAEHQAVANANTATVSRQHFLVFNVQASKDDPTIVDSFTIGSIQMGDTSVPAVWEHIRRFMEEDGPHIPPGEALLQIEPPKSLWQIMTDLGPYGRRFRDWWREHPIMTFFAIIFTPIILPGVILGGICAWLSYITSLRFDWPKEILDAVGEPIPTSQLYGKVRDSASVV